MIIKDNKRQVHIYQKTSCDDYLSSYNIKIQPVFLAYKSSVKAEWVKFF